MKFIIYMIYELNINRFRYPCCFCCSILCCAVLCYAGDCNKHKIEIKMKISYILIWILSEFWTSNVYITYEHIPGHLSSMHSPPPQHKHFNKTTQKHTHNIIQNNCLKIKFIIICYSYLNFRYTSAESSIIMQPFHIHMYVFMYTLYRIAYRFYNWIRLYANLCAANDTKRDINNCFETYIIYVICMWLQNMFFYSAMCLLASRWESFSI